MHKSMMELTSKFLVHLFVSFAVVYIVCKYMTKTIIHRNHYTKEEIEYLLKAIDFNDRFLTDDVFETPSVLYLLYKKLFRDSPIMQMDVLQKYKTDGYCFVKQGDKVILKKSNLTFPINKIESNTWGFGTRKQDILEMLYMHSPPGKDDILFVCKFIFYL